MNKPEINQKSADENQQPADERKGISRRNFLKSAAAGAAIAGAGAGLTGKPVMALAETKKTGKCGDPDNVKPIPPFNRQEQ
jgi:hypothetical protein